MTYAQKHQIFYHSKTRWLLCNKTVGFGKLLEDLIG